MSRHLPLTAAALILFIGVVAAQSGQSASPAPPPQGPPATQQSAPQAPGAPGAPGGRGGLGRGQSMTEPDFSKKPPVVPLSPEEEQKKFWLPPGFKLEPVLTDPDIEEPAQIAFDGNGRMFVLELRGYMQDADASGELDREV